MSLIHSNFRILILFFEDDAKLNKFIWYFHMIEILSVYITFCTQNSSNLSIYIKST